MPVKVLQSDEEFATVTKHNNPRARWGRTKWTSHTFCSPWGWFNAKLERRRHGLACDADVHRC